MIAADTELRPHFLMAYAIARRSKGIQRALIGVERARWNPKSCAKRPKKEFLGAKLVLYGTPSGLLWSASVWRAAEGRHRSRSPCGRPKVALACSLLILALAYRKPTASSKYFKRSLVAATQQKTCVFRFRLARLWRALISSIYIYSRN